jgi:AraC family transcriptional regulator
MDRRIETVIELLSLSLGDEPTLNQLAQSVNLSLSRFQHIFKAETGMSPARYLRMLRLARAKLLLETSFLSVKEIMYRVGANDRSHFEREFKATYGLTPRQCRLANQVFSPSINVRAQSIAGIATK